MDIHTAETFTRTSPCRSRKSYWKVINLQVLIGLQENWSKHRVKHYILRFTDLFVLYGVRSNCHSSGGNLLLYQFTERVIRTDCNNYQVISHISTAYKIASNILLPMLTPYVNEIIGHHRCGFRRNRSTTDQIFYIQ
jgi:hypothetical protein